MKMEISRRNLGLVVAGVAASDLVGVAGRAGAQDMGGDWFAMIREQHRELDRMLSAVQAAPTRSARVAAFKTFSSYLAAHSIAEETSVYPALAITGSQGESKQLYTEQDDAKVLVARIDNALAMGRDVEVPAMLESLASALHAHMAEEETQDFPALQAKVGPAMNAKLTSDFSRTFQRAAS